jgi:hypothetical protein
MQTFQFCYECQDSLATLEYVVVQMNLETASPGIRVSILSPVGTTSILMDLKPNEVSRNESLR